MSTGRYKTHWFELSGGYSIGVGLQRRKRGLEQPPSFIVLAPQKDPSRLRATHCSGVWLHDAAEIRSGVVSVALRAEITHAVRRWYGGDTGRFRFEASR